ncbi:MAG: hypothetical protein A4E56_01351 [Pelotomaculum sp. PtaU1.Bin065]|nr:MAG: hypothetical protein A4E56_01351 [Pelotomaculum sp. PtaU1.Bin065]
MQAVLECLKKTPVLRNNDIFILRDYIRKKYPGSGSHERANILADAVRKIIDRHLQEFNERYRSQIRGSLLQKAVSTNHYTINDDDIFKTCIAIQNYEEDYTEALTRWVNGRQEIPVSRETLRKFVDKVRRYGGDIVQHDWSLILECLHNVEFEPENFHPLPKPALPQIGAWLLKRVAGVCRRASGAWLKNKSCQVMTAILLISIAVSLQPLNILPLSFRQMIVSNNTTNKAHQPTTQLEIRPEDLLYQEVNTAKLRQSLLKRNSILAEEPYFSVIVQSAKEFNVNPIFLFAITGQEQSFVPRQDKEAVAIANNPFNVYHSWTEYNTSIQDSARIASKTISNLLWTKPEAMDALTWINRHYAEDDHWRDGVGWIFQDLCREING